MSKLRHSQVRTLTARFSPSHFIDWHSHTWSQLLYASEGVISVETKLACWIVPTNRGVWVPAGQEHSVKMHGRVFLQTIYIQPENTAISTLNCAAYEIPRLLHELIVQVSAIGIVNGDTDEARNMIDFLTYQLKKLTPFPLMVPMPRDERARRLALQVIEMPGTSKSLHELSSECGASLRTMQRIFSDELGVPLARWRNQVKMIHAVQLLANGGSVTQIAFELGFESVSGFVCSFRQNFGVSPGQYRSKYSRSNA
jgi:AraC-like DNA-binding protein